MDGALKPANLANAGALLLRARLALARAGAVALVVVGLCVAAIAAWAWVLPQRRALERQQLQPLPAPVAPVPVAAAQPPSARQSLDAFYDALGDRRYTEQQVRTLFDLAARNHLVLSEGEYKAGYDKASGVHSLQVLLPLKGSYAAIWEFAMDALRAIPFAALDELTFRRDSIADRKVEARLRLTLYLKDAGAARQP